MILAYLALATLGLIFSFYKIFELRSKYKKYEPIINLEREILDKQTVNQSLKATIDSLESQLKFMKSDLEVLTDDHNLLSSGFYKARYKFATAAEFETRLERVRTIQKELIKNQKAIICSREWLVSGSKAEGKKMTDKIIKLGLSAFNVQCDNEIMTVKFDNIDRSEQKLGKIRELIDKLLEPNCCKITGDFFSLKLEELSLSYEYEEKVAKEKEEQRAIKENMRDDEKARREAEKVQADSEKEEKRYEDALVKARAELSKKSEGERDKYSAKIAELEAQLKEAQENKERAKSMAEQTRRGHVYIISNIGSFGEDVYKIGMTRRLEPMDRVWELSDASVPFDFDVHALIPSEDAPGLEKKLHEIFGGRRVNQVNERKEFFRVKLEEIAAECKNIHKSEMKMTLIAEAKEYRQTVAEKTSSKKKAA